MVLVPPILIMSTMLGLRTAPQVFVGCWTRPPDRAVVVQGSAVFMAQWCSEDRKFCVDDRGDPGFDATWHVSWVFSEDGCTIAAASPIEFHASDPWGHVQSGCWEGPPDWNMDGMIDSLDFFDFLAAWMGGEADFNLDGGTDSVDFFDFLAAFFGG